MLGRALQILSLLLFCALGANAQSINVVLILADDLGPNDLGCFGQSRIKTPAIDSLAARGMKFTDVYATSSEDSAARWGLLIGRDAIGLSGNAPPIPELLGKAGYSTAYIGHFEIDKHPPETIGCQTVVIDSDAQLYPESINVDGKPLALKNEVYTDTDGTRRRKRVDYVNDVFADHAISFIEAKKEKPFFLLFAPQTPAANPARAERDLEAPTGDNPYEKENWPDAEKNKAFAITRLDAYVARIVGKIDELKLTDRTLIILTTDTPSRKAGNTDPSFFRSNGPYRGTRGELFEGSLRVPLIMVLPGKITAGENQQQWAMWDLAPAIGELVGVKIAPTKEAFSMLPALAGKKAEGAFQRFFYFRLDDRSAAVRWQNWKYIRPVGKPPMLFNLINDVSEGHDVSLSNGIIAERLEAKLREFESDLSVKQAK
jgi:arylsulfatase A-like enzyme